MHLLYFDWQSIRLGRRGFFCAYVAILVGVEAGELFEGA
jgi:hypothetical protein